MYNKNKKENQSLYIKAKSLDSYRHLYTFTSEFHAPEMHVAKSRNGT